MVFSLWLNNDYDVKQNEDNQKKKFFKTYAIVITVTSENSEPVMISWMALSVSKSTAEVAKNRQMHQTKKFIVDQYTFIKD